MNDESIFKPESLFWGFISVTMISLLSLIGFIFIPIMRGNWRSRWMQMFIALAVSTMSSDALLHILPQVLGIHNHAYHNSDHQHHHNHDHSDFEVGNNHSDHRQHQYHYHHEEMETKNGHNAHEMLLKMTAVIGAVYIMYLLEFISALSVWKNKNKIMDISREKVVSPMQNGWSKSETNDEQPHSTVGGIANEAVVMCGLNSAAFVIVFGDAIHNFIDGIAIGASFAISNQVGLTTSLAVACHELPHELGDFAVLIESGLSVSRAMSLNFLSALTAYAGLIVGLAAISVNSAVEVLLAITAGMFLYVAWLDMLVHLKTEAASKNDKWYMTLLLQNVGFALGFLIMFGIGWYEETLTSS